jgi:hypothetical protein
MRHKRIASRPQPITAAAAAKWIGVIAAALCFKAIPKEVIYNQVIAVVVRYIDQRPQRLHEGFGSLALEAIYDA